MTVGTPTGGSIPSVPKVPRFQPFPTVPTSIPNDGGADADPAANSHGIFLETFSTRFAVQRWVEVNGGPAGQTPTVKQSTGGVAGDGVMRLTNWNWRESPFLIPYDPSKLYRIRVRVKKVTTPTSGGEEFYCGLVGYAADKITRINSNTGADSVSNSHYIAARQETLGTSFVEFTGFFTGHATNPGTLAAPDPDNPRGLNDGIKYFAPLIIANHATGDDGVVEVDEIAIDLIPDTISLLPDSPVHRKPTIEEADRAWKDELNVLVNGGGEAGVAHNWRKTAFGSIPSAAGAEDILVVSPGSSDPPPRGGTVLELTRTGQCVILSDHLIPIDPTNFEYAIEIFERFIASVGGTPNSYGGAAFWTEDGTYINPRSWYNGGSEGRSQINGAVSVGDPTITVDDGAGMGYASGALTNEYIVFQADPVAGTFSDLPNFFIVQLSNRSGNVLTVNTADHPSGCPFAAADNEWTRRHRSGASYNYATHANQPQGDGTSGGGWNRWIGTIGPEEGSPIAPFQNPNSISPNFFPAGAAFMRLLILCNRDVTSATTQFLGRIMRRPLDFDIGSVGADKVGKGGSKTLPEDIRQTNGATVQRIAKGYQAGQAATADAVTYLTGFQNIPAVIIGSPMQLCTHRPDAKWGTLPQTDTDAGTTAYTTADPTYLVLQALNPTAAGFDMRAVLLQKAASQTFRTLDFAASLLSLPFDVNTTEGTSWVRVTISSFLPSNNDQYQVSFECRVTATGGTPSKNAEGIVTATVAVDSSFDGAVWTERATRSFDNEICCGNGPTTLTFQRKNIIITVSGMTNGDFIRVRYADLVIQTFIGPGTVTGSATVEGWNNTIDTSVEGVEWFTSVDNWASATPDVADFAGYQALEVAT